VGSGDTLAVYHGAEIGFGLQADFPTAARSAFGKPALASIGSGPSMRVRPGCSASNICTTWFGDQTITLTDNTGRSLSFAGKENVDTVKGRISYLFSIH
jgi:hypothetical protein